MHTVLSDTSELPDLVGTIEWVSTPTRIYGIDSLGNVFIFRTPRATPAHLAPRRPGRLRILAGRFIRGPVFS